MFKRRFAAATVAAAIALAPVAATPEAQALDVQQVQRQAANAAQGMSSFIFAPVPDEQVTSPFGVAGVWMQRALVPIIGLSLVAGTILLIVDLATGERTLADLSSGNTE